MNKYRLALTDDEEMLVARIDFGTGDAHHDQRYAAYLGNQAPILALLASLRERDAIPAHRLAYWNDSAYNPGRIKASRHGIFERNGCSGDAIYTHPNFLKHLRYILFGADLPAKVAAEFEAEVGDPQWVSYGDALELGRFARAQVRRYRLQPGETAAEYFKLALDIGLDVESALRIERIVHETR